ncbi:MAG: ASKHA domain-containing protein, partial [Nitrososphaerota archaeon]
MVENRVRVRIPQYNMIVDASIGETLLDIIQKAGIGIRSVCGGKGFCGKCKILVKGKVDHRLMDKSMISEEDLEKGYVLACLAKVKEDVEVYIPPESQLSSAKLLTSFLLPKFTLEPVVNKIRIVDYLDLVKLTTFYRIKSELYSELERKISSNEVVDVVVNSINRTIIDINTSGKLYGVAVDVGTTKVVVGLVDLNTGVLVDVASEFNKQLMYGEDLVARISHAIERKSGLNELQNAVVETINALILDLCDKHGLRIENIYQASIAGNTVMTYLFIGIDPHPLIHSFKTPVRIDPKPYILDPGKIGIKINKNGLVYVLPCCGRFLGGDVIGDILTSAINEQDQPSLLIDIGTNTEIVIGCRSWFIGTTAPAGPAFEGWGLKHGVRAIKGAIESVKIDPESLKAYYSTIGGVKPIGICGSGYIDLIAQLFVNGVIDRRGKFYRNINSPYVREGSEGYEYVVVPAEESSIGRDIVITEKDIYNLIDAKSSVCAGISVLLRRMHLTVNDIRKVYICGAFGKYLNINSAIAIGMIPEFPNAEITY